MKSSTESRAFLCGNGRNATGLRGSSGGPPLRARDGTARSSRRWRGARDEDLPIAQGRGAVGVIILVFAELTEAPLLVERDRWSVVIAHFEGELAAAVQARILLARPQQRGADSPTRE